MSTQSKPSPAYFLQEGEPDPSSIVNPNGRSSAFITCDHASNLIPQCLDQLKLSPQDREKHIAYDIGILWVSNYLSELLDAQLLHSNYSRLVIDLNRQLHDPSCIPAVSDHVVIPGNQDLSVEDRQCRAEALFWPYHRQFSQRLDQYRDRGIVPVIVGMHSFTPVWQGQVRPWDIGVMWDCDDRIAAPFMENLKQQTAICVGDNRPYHAIDPHGIDPVGYAFDVHARTRGLPHIFLEVRQDLIDNPEKAKHWAQVIFSALKPLLDDNSLHYVLE